MSKLIYLLSLVTVFCENTIPPFLLPSFPLPRCPPRSFVPALCKIFMDKDAPDNVLEVTARAITYYLDVSVDCTRRITAVDGALKAIITRMKTSDISSRTSKDLAEQCVKVRHIGSLFPGKALALSFLVRGEAPNVCCQWSSYNNYCHSETSIM